MSKRTIKKLLKNYFHTIDGYKAVQIITFIYIFVVCIFMISHRIWFSPDQFFVFGLFGTTLIGKARLFLKDWTPFLFFYMGYEFLRGLVPYVTKNVHIFPMINTDKFIFGFIPTVKLQSWLYNPVHLHWYDYVAVTLYICHFVTPMIVGYLFWLKDRILFKKYTLGILGVSYAAFITYIIFPAMPPWMASGLNYIPPIKEVTGVVMSHFLRTDITLPSVLSFAGGNPVAAVPSLHAALPLMVFFFLYKWKKIAGLAFIPYVLGVWFAVIYLGEHYFIDVVIGALYSTVVYFIIDKFSFRILGNIFLHRANKKLVDIPS